MVLSHFLLKVQRSVNFNRSVFPVILGFDHHMDKNVDNKGNFIYAFRIISKTFMEQNTIQYSYYWSFTLFLLLISSDEYSFVRQCLNNNFMKKWGKYSFGVYLFHPTSFKLYDLIIPNAFFQVKNCYEQIFLICLITYAIAYLFYILIESNMTKLALYLCNKVETFAKTNNNYILFFSK